MGYDKEKIKQIRWLMIFGALLILALIYSTAVWQGVALCVQIMKPFIYGGIIAFVLNLPMRGIESKVFAKWKGNAAKKLKRPISMILSVIVVLLVVLLVFMTVVPQITKTITVLGNKVPAFMEDVFVWLENISARYPQLEEEIAQLESVQINWESVMDKAASFLKNGVTSMLTSTVNVASSIIGGVINGVISFIFALYVLGQKEKLGGQGRRILTAFLPEKICSRILYICTLLHKNFSNFITGQCLEAVILGTLFVVFMTIFRMPYAVMIGVLIAFTALIPVVGAFIGCAVGAFLILIENPIQALWFVILFLALQQIEGNLIYPRVVGNSVGLPSIWVLMAVSAGGSLFGVAGILFFIPLLSTVYALLREDVNKRNARKKKEKLPQDDSLEDTGHQEKGSIPEEAGQETFSAETAVKE